MRKPKIRRRRSCQFPRKYVYAHLNQGGHERSSSHRTACRSRYRTPSPPAGPSSSAPSPPAWPASPTARPGCSTADWYLGRWPPGYPRRYPGGHRPPGRAAGQRPVMLVRRVCRLPETGQRYRPEICTRAAAAPAASHRGGPSPPRSLRKSHTPATSLSLRLVECGTRRPPAVSGPAVHAPKAASPVRLTSPARRQVAFSGISDLSGNARLNCARRFVDVSST